MQLQSASPFSADASSLIFCKQHAKGYYRGGHLFYPGLQKFMEDTKGENEVRDSDKVLFTVGED